jgi:hypothetical protein
MASSDRSLENLRRHLPAVHILRGSGTQNRGVTRGTGIACLHGVKKFALLTGCLLFLACSDGGGGDNTGRGGQAGGQAGSTGTGGKAGAGGGTATGGSAGSSAIGGHAGSSPGTGGTAGGGGHAGGGGGHTGGTGGQAGGTGGQAGGGHGGGAAGQSGGGAGGHAGQAGGAGGNGGAGGAAGSAGGAGGAGGSICNALATAYGLAFNQARMCNASLSTAQCTHLVMSSLSCGCQAWVNDTTTLDPLAAQWTSAGCTTQICPAVACTAPGTSGVCVVANAGDLCMGTN